MAQSTRIAAYGILTDGDSMLLCRLSEETKFGFGMWTLPGGGIDFGEDPEAAMVREVFEETGLTVVSEGLIDVDSLLIKRDGDEFHSIRVLYRARVVGGELRNEIDGTTDLCAWIPRTEMGGIKMVGLARLGVDLAFS